MRSGGVDVGRHGPRFLCGAPAARRDAAAAFNDRRNQPDPQRAGALGEDGLRTVADDDRGRRGSRLDEEVACRRGHISRLRKTGHLHGDRNLGRADHERAADAFEEPGRVLVPLRQRGAAEAQATSHGERDVRVEHAPSEGGPEQGGKFAGAGAVLAGEGDEVEPHGSMEEG